LFGPRGLYDTDLQVHDRHRLPPALQYLSHFD